MIPTNFLSSTKVVRLLPSNHLSMNYIVFYQGTIYQTISFIILANPLTNQHQAILIIIFQVRIVLTKEITSALICSFIKQPIVFQYSNESIINQHIGFYCINQPFINNISVSLYKLTIRQEITFLSYHAN